MERDKKGEEKRKFFSLNRRKFFYLSGIFGMALLSGKPKISMAISEKEVKMAYQAKDYNRVLGMEGFSDTLLKNHFTLVESSSTSGSMNMTWAILLGGCPF